MKFSIIIPAHNEAENLKILLPKISSVFKNIVHEIILVDNASSDETGKVVQELRIPFCTRVVEPYLGYGRAVLKGLASAQGELMGIIRADNQEKPEDFLSMYHYCRDNKFDFCKAVRKSRLSDGLQRIIVSKLYNTFFNIIFNVSFRDINATPKIFTREFYTSAHLISYDWFIDAEMVLAASKGYRIGEVEIEYFPRLKGASTVRLVHILQFLKNILKWRFKKKTL